MLDTLFVFFAIVGGGIFTVRPGSGGQVHVSVQERLGIFEAVCGGERELATGTPVRVIAVRADKLVSEAIQNLEIDKITVWDSGGRNGKASSTSSFLSSLVTSLPPPQEIAKMAGVELPEYLGRVRPEEQRGGKAANR